jgi:hypothetical protein
MLKNSIKPSVCEFARFLVQYYFYADTYTDVSIFGKKINSVVVHMFKKKKFIFYF